MLQGLVIRQAFLVLDGLVIAGVVLMALLIGITYSTGIVSPEPILPTGEEAAPHSDVVAQVRSRSEYDLIINNKLFGPAGQIGKDPSEIPAPPEPPVQETQLKLRLCGTAATSPRDRFATAIIQNDDINAVGTYAVGQEVTLDVVLEEVYPRKVILYNKAANRREVLRSDGDKGDNTPVAQGAPPPGQPSPAPAPPTSPAAIAPSAGEITVKKAEVFRNLNFDTLRDMKVTFQYDGEGKADGVASSNWESHSLGTKLGLKNGDVIKTINGEPISENNDLPKVVTKFRNAKTIRLGIVRNGQPSVITYTLEP